MLGGNVRIHFESTTEQFEIIIQKAYQQTGMYPGVVPIDNSLSWITIEQHDASGTEGADTIESAGTIEITSGFNGLFAFQHVDVSLQIFKDILDRARPAGMVPVWRLWRLRARLRASGNSRAARQRVRVPTARGVQSRSDRRALWQPADLPASDP